ncbi:hypothetical protein CEXT_81771 [Caerostris extrusa]|uniref:CS domain-containing protein n=1 Tax=Caerostris extrusa TaxID=172846 RepID=A0AAV4RZI1_CAEEX|nr:hypothetical protein CEXT_81771 [Caerostris extrusa]
MRYQYDWYQTESHVVINILIKKVKPENARIDIEDSTKLSCIAKLADDTAFSFILNLAHEVGKQHSLEDFAIQN